MDQQDPSLFNPFPATTTEEWEARIHDDLKGADYRKKLIWAMPEGIEVKPYYRQADLADNPIADLLPGQFPYTRRYDANGNPWKIREEIESEDAVAANILALQAITKGADEVCLAVQEGADGPVVEKLIAGIDLSRNAIHFASALPYPELVKVLSATMEKLGQKPSKANGSFDFDPLTRLLLNGDFNQSEKDDKAEFAFMFNTCSAHLPNFRFAQVNAHYFNSAGADLVQELAFALAMGNEYLCWASELGLGPDLVAQKLQFSFSVGADYFPEMAKLRAARQLWANIVKQHGVENASAQRMHLHCQTSSWNKSLYDPYVNLLRTTTETMSAILGGADAISVQPFDAVYKNPDEFSNRLARNQQIILRDEAYLNKVSDPGAGSWYIETLTQQIADAAWKLFLEIEGTGGMLEAIKKGVIQQKVEQSANEKRERVATRKMVILGTNQYPNQNETMLDKFGFDEDPEEDMIEEEGEETSPAYAKLELLGATDDFDHLRLSTEQYVSSGGKQPGVFLFNYGNLAMRKARAMFITNFFGCAGYKIYDNDGFTDFDKGVRAAVESGAEIVVLCSSDEEYNSDAALIAQLLQKAKQQLILVVAGFPKEEVENLKAAGIDEFVHVRSNLLETLEDFQARLNII